VGIDMNVIMGLCVGHDMLFVKHADAPTATLVAKDRVTGHNPVAALFGNHFHYKRLAKQPVSSPRDPGRLHRTYGIQSAAQVRQLVQRSDREPFSSGRAPTIG
jgi:hypothetical protein